MRTGDSLMELDEEQFEYSYIKYLLDCRQKLMHKVEDYRTCIEKQTSKEASLIHKHGKEVKLFIKPVPMRQPGLGE